MKLHYSPTSPYVRKVMVTAIEAGVDARIEKADAAASPVGVNPTLNADNPLGKVPCLVTDDGQALFDSRVICEYLDSVGGGKLFPAAGPARWTALRRQAQGDGLLDAALLARYETAVRPGDRLWPEWRDGQKAKMARALDAFETEADSLGDTIDIGTIAVACALGYVDFRFDADRWRDSRPKLAAWFAGFAARPSMTATAAPTG
ncbi:MAG: glutathione S-transferase family protein [Alphaproteobacteria bacterium]